MKFYFTILLAVIAYNAIAQMKIDFSHAYLQGGDQSIYKERHILVNNLGEKYIIAPFKGSYTSNGITITSNLSALSSLSRALLIAKYDSNDNQIWLKKICESDSLVFYKSCLDFSGNLLLGVTNTSNLFTCSDTIINVEKRNDFVLFKIDSSGHEFFRKRVASSCNEVLICVTADTDDNIYFSGEFGYDPNNTSNNCPTFFDSIFVMNGKHCFLAKLDSNGIYKWVKKIDIDLLDFLRYHEGNVYCTGICESNINDFGGIPLIYPSTEYTSRRFLGKLDTSGNGIWVRHFGLYDVSAAYVANQGLAISKNLVYFTGNASSNNANIFKFQGGPTLFGIGSGHDFMLASYDTNGNFKWNRVSNSYGSEYLIGLSADSNCNVYGAGVLDYTLIFPSDTIYSNGGDDILVCSYDSNGNFRWATNGGGANTDVGKGIALDNNGKVYIVGGTTSTECYMGNDVLFPTPGQSTLFFASIDSIGAPNTVHNISVENESINIYPNPANDIISVRLETGNDKLKEIILYNTLGQEVITETKTTTFNVSHLPNGFYSLQCVTDKTIFNKKIIIQHSSE